MKKIVFKYLVIAVVVTTAFNSCKKDKDEDEEDHYTVKLLKGITHISDDKQYKYDQYKFEYDEQDRITKISKFFFDGELSYIVSFTYERDDLVQVLYSFSSGSTEMYEYTKSGNTITQKYTYNGDGVSIPGYTTTYTIELNSDGLPVRREPEEEESGNTNVETFEYQDGNLTKNAYIFTSGDYTETYTNTYYYDDKKGTLYNCKTPKWYLIMYLNDWGVNNNVTEGGHAFRPWTVFTYKYDNEGFPAERTHNFLGQMHESESNEVFTYTKE